MFSGFWFPLIGQKLVSLYPLVAENNRPQKKLVSRYQFQVLVKTIGALLLPISLNIELVFYVYIWSTPHNSTKIGATIDLFEHQNVGANTSLVTYFLFIASSSYSFNIWIVFFFKKVLVVFNFFFIIFFNYICICFQYINIIINLYKNCNFMLMLIV